MREDLDARVLFPGTALPSSPRHRGVQGSAPIRESATA